MIRRAFWALQRRIWGLGPASVYQPGRAISSRIGRSWPLFVTFVFAACLASACGGVERHARTALDVTAHGVVAADAVVATVYERRAEEARGAALAAHPGRDEDDAVRADYRDRMSHLDAAVVALRTTRTALIDAQAVLDADGQVLPTIGCVGVALAHLVDALRDAGVDPPPKLAQALGAITKLAAPLCPVGGGS